MTFTDNVCLSGVNVNPDGTVVPISILSPSSSPRVSISDAVVGASDGYCVPTAPSRSSAPFNVSAMICAPMIS